eukprot:256401_1
MLCNIVFLITLLRATRSLLTSSNFIYVNDKQVTYLDAQSYCQSTYRTDLATITNEAEHIEISKLIDTGNNDYAWIGLNDLTEEGTFIWFSKYKLTFTKWANGQPDNYQGYENCACIGNNYWYDSVCNNFISFVCDKPSLEDIDESLIASYNNMLQFIKDGIDYMDKVNYFETYIQNIEKTINLLNDSITILRNQVQTTINPNVDDYKSWNIDQILYWIAALDEGTFKPYIKDLKKGFNSIGICEGEDLQKLKENDFYQEPFNIADRYDIPLLYLRIEQLINLKQEL